MHAPWKWEFWPFGLFYAPVYLKLLLRIAAGSRPGLLTCANPGIPYGGLLEYSKWSLLVRLPTDLVPQTVLVRADDDTESVMRVAAAAQIGLPMIIKPDVGERGFLVEKVSTSGELRGYLSKVAHLGSRRFLVQQYVDLPVEYGVMYARHRDRAGEITSIVRKEFLSVTGDGRSSMQQLIDAHPRARLHRSTLGRRYASRLAEVPADGASIPLVEIGNHARGATFRDGRGELAPHLRELARRFQELSDLLPGFSIGRYDVRTASAEDLVAGRFSIIEVNGANSEPAHIYDPDNRLLYAYRDLLAHWDRLLAIAEENRRAGCKPAPARVLVGAIRAHFAQIRRARSEVA